VLQCDRDARLNDQRRTQAARCAARSSCCRQWLDRRFHRDRPPFRASPADAHRPGQGRFGSAQPRHRRDDEQVVRFLDAYDLLVFGTSRLRPETLEPSGADVVVWDRQEFLDPADGTADDAVTPVDLATKRMLKSAARRILSAAGSTPVSTQPVRENWRVPRGARLKSAFVHQQQSDFQPLTQVIAKVSWMKIDNQSRNWSLIPCMEPGT
jgi:hypothetical protein